MEQPFDARRVMLEDATGPAHRWTTPGLVTGLRYALLGDAALRSDDVVTDDEWYKVVYGMSLELTQRGIDGSSLIRYGLLPEVANRLITVILADWLPPRDPEDLTADQLPLPEAADDWRRLLPSPWFRAEDLTAPEGAGNFRRFLTLVTLKVLPWVACASVDELIRLHCPTQEELDNCSVDADLVMLLTQYRWLVDRFSETHLTQWSVESLHAELRWLTGDEAPACNAELMDDRVVDLQALQAEVAARAITRDLAAADDAWPGMQQTLAHKVHSQALLLLEQGRHREAAALFEFAASESPRDAAAVNNHGFCLIPDDPLTALGKLRQAESMGYPHTLINGYNQALCLQQLGRTDEAVKTLTSSLRNYDPRTTPGASLWVLEEGQLQFLDRVDVAETAHGLRTLLRRLPS